MKREKYMPKRHAKQMLAVTLATTMCVPAGIPLVSMTAFGQTMEHSDQQEESDFEELRLKWKTLLTGGEALDNTGKLGEDYIASVNKAAQVQWDSMNKLGDATEDTRTCIFPDIPMTDKSTKTGSSQITLTFDRLKAIALAYETSESDYYQKEDVKKEIVAALDMMIANHYSLSYACSGTGTGHGSGNHSFGNWCIILILFTTSVGQPIVLYVAALGNVDRSLVEAAEVDGATKLQTFWKIKWPSVMPTTLYVAIITTINSFQCFALIQLLTSGGPQHSTDTVMYYLYTNAFTLYRYGYANAVGVVLAIIIALFSVLQFKTMNTGVEY